MSNGLSQVSLSNNINLPLYESRALELAPANDGLIAFS